MTRIKSTERLNLSYERVVEHEDDGRDPHPSFPPMRIVPTDGVTVDECTVPIEEPVRLAKCIPFARSLRRVG